jgi:hypothetical protein
MGCRPHRAEAMVGQSLGDSMLTAVPVVSKGRRRHQSKSRRERRRFDEPPGTR